MIADPGVRPPTVTVEEYGDSGLLVHVDAADPEERWAVAHGLAGSLRADPPAGFTDLVASFADVFLAFDPMRTDHVTLAAAVRSRSAARASRTGREHLVPVVYGGEHGPDLQGVAAELGLEPAELVRRHAGEPWTVRLCASPAGAPMADGPVLPAPVSRCAEPRVRVPAGSVALSGAQCVIYPVVSPGGWRLVGRTPARLVDACRTPIVEYRPGDQLRFVPVPAGEWERWSRPLRELQAELADTTATVAGA